MNNVFIKKLTQKESLKVYTKKNINIILINVINVIIKKSRRCAQDYTILHTYNTFDTTETAAPVPIL